MKGVKEMRMNLGHPGSLPKTEIAPKFNTNPLSTAIRRMRNSIRIKKPTLNNDDTMADGSLNTKTGDEEFTG